MKPNVCPVGASTAQCVMVFRSGWMGASDWEVIKFFVCALWRSRKLHASICALVTLSYQCLNRINAIDFRAGRAVTMTVTNCAPYASDVACSIFSADHLCAV